jgi:acetyl-CoA carboxylase beta subunit
MLNGLPRLPAPDRIGMTADEGTFQEISPGADFYNPLNFDGYEEKVKLAE